VNKRLGGYVFAFLVGVAITAYLYRWLPNPRLAEERQMQEDAVQVSRRLLEEIVASGPLDIVDPLAPNRKIGKVYIYPFGDGWQVSGYYRRNDRDLWHPYLMNLDGTLEMSRLKLSDRDAALLRRAASDARLEVLP